MADGTLHGAFELSADQPIRQLRGIRDAGASADTSLGALGRTMDRLVSPIATERLNSYNRKVESVGTTAETTSERVGRAWENTTRKMSDQITVMEGRVDDLDAKLDRFGSKSVDATVGLDGVVEANAQLAELEARLDRLDRRNATARVGLSGGLFSNAAGGGGGGALTTTGGRAARSDSQTLFHAIGGLPTLALAALGLSPGIMGLLGGATALVGSAGAAALGAGAVGVGGAGVGVVGGLGAFAGIKSGVSELQNITKAQAAYTKAVQEYGKASTEAASAQQKLRQEEVANAQALPMFRQLTALKSDFTKALAPARAQFYTAGTDVLYNLRRGVPAFGRDATISTGAVGRAATTYSRFLTSTPTLAGVSQLTNAFASDMPLIERTVQNLTSTLEHLAVAAIPFFHEGLAWIASWSGGLAKSTADTAKVGQEMQGLVNSAKDWGRLLGSASTLLKDIFSAGQPSGDSMVVQLTHTLDRWDQWINNNPQKVDAFFTRAEHTTSQIARGVATIAGDFAKLGQLLGPIFDRALGLANILLSLGPGGASLLAGGLFGGLRGLRGAGYRAPTFGGLARSYLGGSPTSAINSTARGGGGVVPLPLAAGGSTARALAQSEAAAFEHVVPLSSRFSTARLTPMGSPLGEQFYAAYGGQAEARFAGPILAAERDASTVAGSLRSAVGTARSALGSLGEGVKTFGAGALRVAGPIVAFQALMSGLNTQPGVPGSDSGGGFQGFWMRALHGFGIGPGYTSPTTQGQQDARRAIANLRPGVNPVPQLLNQLGAAGAVVNVNTGRTEALPARAFAQAAGIGTAAASALSQQAGQVTTAQGAHVIANQVAELRLDLPPKEAAKLSAELRQITSTAFGAAGTAAGTRWEAALSTALTREKPSKAVATVLSGMTEQIKHLGPQGSLAMARNMAGWAQTMIEQNPKLLKPMETLMNGIIDRMNRVGHTVGNTFADLQGKIFYFNGQILKGSAATWSHIGNALTDPLAVAQEKALGIFKQIQAEAVNSLTQMGFSKSQATNIVTTLAGHSTFNQATSAIATTGTAAANTLAGNSPAAGTRSTSSPTAVPSRPHRARGGVIGGVGLLDTVGLPDGSMAAPGEGWIANGPTMDDLSRATIPMYGKTAWQMIQGETIPHSSWGRVFRPGQRRRNVTGGPGPQRVASTTGNVVLDSGVNMTVGQEPQILQDLYKLSSELHNAVYVISGYRTPAHSVAVGGFADDPHTKGEAADIGIGGPSRDSMLGVSEASLRAVGLYRPFYPADPNEVNHVQLLAGGGSGVVPVGGGARGGYPPVHLKGPRGGMLGVPGVLLDRMSQVYASGLSQQVNKKLGTMAGGGGSTAGLSGSLVNMVNQLSHRFGWGPGDVSAWLQVINRESGGSMTATNPSSGAYGIAQFINGAGEYAQYGGNSTTQSGQLLAMANYIKGRYGTPSSAWSHEQSAGWYGLGGGPVKWGGWHHKGLDTTVDSPTIFGAGDRGRRERVQITPTASRTQGQRPIQVIMQHVNLSAEPKDIKRVGEKVAEEILKHLDGADEHDLAGVS